MMSKLVTKLAAGVALAAIFTGCTEPETADPTLSAEQPLKQSSASAVFSSTSGEEPLPADQVFFPDAYAEDGQLLFRIQMLPGYYLYKDKFELRSLSDSIGFDEHGFNEKWSHSDVIVDEWFGEQEVFFDEAHGMARMHLKAPGIRTVEFELSYQGCKKDDICYMPQTKVLSVDIPAQLESSADKTE